MLRDAAAALDSLGAAGSARDQLTALCRSALVAFGASAVSVARIVEGPDLSGLVYEAAAGAGEDGIVGIVLAGGRGIGGFVAATGQPLIVDQVQADPRFARDVAEAVGHIPGSMLVVPIPGTDGDPLGVLSVLDRSAAGQGFELASAFAAQAALLLPTIDQASRFGRLLLDSLAAALERSGADHPAVEVADLVDELRETEVADDAELADVAALLMDLRHRPADVRAGAMRVLVELLALSAPRSRR